MLSGSSRRKALKGVLQSAEVEFLEGYREFIAVDTIISFRCSLDFKITKKNHNILASVQVGLSD